MTPLYIESVGAMTSVGLSGYSTCAAIRAGLSGVADAIQVPPPGEPIKGARVKAGRALRKTPRDWLVNLAAEAINQCAEATIPSRLALLVCAPDANREHPANLQSDEVLGSLAVRCKLQIDPSSRLFETGAAGLAQALATARELLRRRTVDRCIVGGVDSLLADPDIKRLQKMKRLYGEGNPQGVIPGEGAVFLAVSASGRESPFVPIATILGFATDVEPNPVDGPAYSVGEGLGRTIKKALADAGVSEPEVDFVVSDHNGERYSGWESTMAHTRVYRTRRDHLAVVYPSSAVGHMGAASAPLGVMVAAVAIARGHAPGSKAICEFQSESQLRGACAVGAPPIMPAFVSPSKRRPRGA